jgi:hypothetical protein
MKVSNSCCLDEDMPVGEAKAMGGEMEEWVRMVDGKADPLPELQQERQRQER